MGLGAFSSLMAGLWSYMDTYEIEDMLDDDSVIAWFEADEETRKRMELEIGDDGKIRFEERARELGFFR